MWIINDIRGEGKIEKGDKRDRNETANAAYCSLLQSSLNATIKELDDKSVMCQIAIKMHLLNNGNL